VPVESIQTELIRQKARLMFYWDVPLEHPAFAAIQKLSVQGVVQGYPDRLFRPGEPLTRAEFASLAVRGRQIRPSVSDFHFSDVPWTHWAFRDIETMFDNKLLGAFGVEPRWPGAGTYRGNSSAGFARNVPGAFGAFEPGRPVTWAEFIGVLRDCEESKAAFPGSGIVRPTPRRARPDDADWVRRVAATTSAAAALRDRNYDPGAIITRADAAMMVLAAR